MAAEEYVNMISNPAMLGSPTLKTQHLTGASRYQRVSDTEIIGHHQLRVAHQIYEDNTLSKVVVKGHAHSYNKHWYKKIDGQWKFAGLAPELRWSEYDFDKIVAEGRNHAQKTQRLPNAEFKRTI
ncbi:hypothetical protein LCI18_004767 [Fusarium solani-melongenae]|uniref:Uncharacterized protein n=1 Tax=Fusarium solani subsp. cucurbitae TaxID=2747967 RepID=A0ACD3YY86_FUSSC|nr:hypothetical protein LCI18_004767 [Fusarium solani-melongenae]